MKKIILYSLLIISIFLLYLSFVLYLKSNDNINYNYDNKKIEIYTIYLEGEVNYKGPLELKKGTKLKDFIYDYLTNNSDLSAIDDNEEIINYKLYEIPYKNKLNINTCTKTELMNLSGIGEAYSNKIIQGRPYNNIEELKTKKIIGEALYEQIKNEISCE